MLGCAFRARARFATSWPPYGAGFLWEPFGVVTRFEYGEIGVTVGHACLGRKSDGCWLREIFGIRIVACLVSFRLCGFHRGAVLDGNSRLTDSSLTTIFCWKCCACCGHALDALLWAWPWLVTSRDLPGDGPSPHWRWLLTTIGWCRDAP